MKGHEESVGSYCGARPWQAKKKATSVNGGATVFLAVLGLGYCGERGPEQRTTMFDDGVSGFMVVEEATGFTLASECGAE